jgi:Uma2 family endonuclease
MEGTVMARPMAQHARKLTYDDFVHFPDDGQRHELIDGEHVVSPSPNTRHQRVVLHLVTLLHTLVRQHDLGMVFVAPYDVVLSIHDVVEPDLLFVARERLALLTEANLQGAPDLAVEVLSPSNRRQDELRKRDLYERRGVAEYWVVDPEAETVKVFRREGETYGRPLLLSARDGDALDTPLLPGLAVSLAEVFAP